MSHGRIDRSKQGRRDIRRGVARAGLERSATGRRTANVVASAAPLVETDATPYQVNLPDIPESMPSLLGPVHVTRVKDLRDKNGRGCFGIWRNDVRDVRLDADMHLVTAWHTYWHEWVHVALWDAGVVLKDADAERVCDAIATLRTREMIDAT